MVEDKGSILALDLGSVRVGVAIANKKVRLAHPLGTLLNDDTLIHKLHEICDRETVTEIIVGLPRGLEGQETDQTSSIRVFGAELAKQLDRPISWQDEAVTSNQAETELKKTGKPYVKADIDSLAATYILEDYLREQV